MTGAPFCGLNFSTVFSKSPASPGCAPWGQAGAGRMSGMNAALFQLGLRAAGTAALSLLYCGSGWQGHNADHEMSTLRCSAAPG